MGAFNIGGISVTPREEMTMEQRFESDQAQASGYEHLCGLVEILADTLVEWKLAHGAEAHPGRDVAPQVFVEALMELNENQSRGLLMMSCWVLAEAFVEHQVLLRMLDHECGPECDHDQP